MQTAKVNSRWAGVLAVAGLALTVSPSRADDPVRFVGGDAANLRSAPSLTASVQCTLSPGTELRLKGQQGEWRQVYVPSKQTTGWIVERLLSDTPPAGQARDVKYVRGDDVNIRSGPGQRFDRVGILPKGTRVDVVAYEGQWRKIRVPETGEIGWVADWLLSGGDDDLNDDAPAAAAGQVRYAGGDDLCLRSGPGGQHQVLCSLALGTRFQVIEVGSEWCKVRLDSGTTGYVSRQYVTDSVPGAPLIRLQGGAQFPGPQADPFGSLSRGAPGTGAPILSGESPTGFRPVDTLSQPAASSAPRDPTTITATQVRVAATALSGDGLVQEGLVNVRAGPGMGFNLIGQATRGTPLRVIGATNGWFLVRFASGAEGWVAGWLVATDQSIAQQISPAQTPAGQPTSLGNSIAQYALGFVGTPYVFGGSSPSGFDCSGLVQYVLKHHNIRVPRTSFEQWDVGTPVDPSRLIPGDLVFFANTYTAGVSHVGIYVGNGNFVHASRSGVGVIVQPLKERAGSYCGARRVY